MYQLVNSTDHIEIEEFFLYGEGSFLLCLFFSKISFEKKKKNMRAVIPLASQQRYWVDHSKVYVMLD